MKRDLPLAKAPLATTAALAEAIAGFAQSDGDYETALPALSLHRRQGPTAPLHCVFSLGLGVVAQGEKQVLLGDEVIRYGPGQSMLTTIDLPVISHVTRASAREPLLGLMVLLDTGDIVRLAADMGLSPPARRVTFRPISIETLGKALLDPLLRLVRLLDDLAALAGMSPSTFRQHFRTVTGTSPLQYQKTLRLQEARQLMLSQDLDAGNASGLVGYESPSQFSREYSRLFGAPPRQDVRRLRQTQLR
jgi:AraC-like DNA-binding protein